MKKMIALFLALVLILTLAACSDGAAETAGAVLATQVASEPAVETVAIIEASLDTKATVTAVAVEYDDEDLDASVDGSDLTTIWLEGDSATLEGSGATVEDTVVTITSAGTYSISGTLVDGQIVVETEDEGTVVLVLNGVDIACSTSAPIYVVNAEKTVITLADGSENFVTDGDSYVLADPESDEPSAAIFSNDDLTINGSGSLTVDANYNNGIASKDDLKITGGELHVNAVNDGLKGKDSIAVKDGVITVSAGGDGMQSSNEEDADKGYISIEGGSLSITAGLDGVQAETQLVVSGGDLTISSGGGSVNSSSNGGGLWDDRGMSDDSGSAESAKGLKAGVDITITGGSIHIDSSDDALHSNGSLTIEDGEIVLASGDDGVHADSTLEIYGGNLAITQSYEGLESAIVTIHDGTIHLVSSDDGINVAGGNDGSSINGRPGQNSFSASGNFGLYIHGGTIAIDAGGDGLDSNGSITMTDGVVLVNGPTNDGNGALDYMGTFDITGGYLVAVGSSGMAEAPSESSTQYSVMYNFTAQQAAGTIVHIEAQDGTEILTFAAAKAYRSVVLSSPELENGSTYVVYTGGSSTGTASDGLYAGGTYSGGTEVASLTISGMVTRAGASGGGFRGRAGG
jgi:hypothetical protein